MSNLLEILSKREIGKSSGFENHGEEIIARRELVNGCSIDKPYIQDGHFRLKLDNGSIFMIAKEIVELLHDLMRQNSQRLVFNVLLAKHSWKEGSVDYVNDSEVYSN